MPWATLEFYKDKFLMGDTPLIPDQSFPRWEQAARNRIDRKGIVDVPTDELMHCVCEVADELYSQSQAEKVGAVQSFSNKGYGESYVDQRKKSDDFEKNINSIIARRLFGSVWWNDLVYAGVS